MNEYFKSALSNIGSTLAGAGSFVAAEGGSSQDNEFVGQTVDLKGQKIRIESVIAEGMFHVKRFGSLIIMVFIRWLRVCFQSSGRRVIEGVCSKTINRFRQGV